MTGKEGLRESVYSGTYGSGLDLGFRVRLLERCGKHRWNCGPGLVEAAKKLHIKLWEKPVRQSGSTVSLEIAT